MVPKLRLWPRRTQDSWLPRNRCLFQCATQYCAATLAASRHTTLLGWMISQQEGERIKEIGQP